MSRQPSPLVGLVVGALLCATGRAQVQAPLLPKTSVITDVVLDTTEEAEHFDIVIRDGRIVSIDATGAELPAGAKVFEGKGMLVQAGFIDAWTTSGVETPTPVADQDVAVDIKSDVRAGMRDANRKGIAPSFRAADVVDFGVDGAGAWRTSGFGVLLAAPSGQLLGGHGALLVTRGGPRRELILNPEVFQFGEFDASGGGFPSTLMGYFAQLRQFFFDAERQAKLEARYTSGEEDTRPVWDPELRAGTMLIGGRELYVVRADRAGDVERWIRLADEFQLRIAIAGGREAGQHAALLKERGIPVLLDMDFGEEVKDPAAKEEKKDEEPEAAPEELIDGPNANPESEELTASPLSPEADDEAAEEEAEEEDAGLWHYEEPEALKIERRRLWEERRDNAQELVEAGVRVLFATGERKPKELFSALRMATAEGLDREVVRTALTVDAARFLGLGEHLGSVSVGRDANFGVWTSDPFDEDASLALMVVDGRVEEFEVTEKGKGPAEGLDASGTWTIITESEDAPEGATLIIEMDDTGRVTGSFSMVSPMSGDPMSTSVKGSVSDKQLKLKGEFDFDGMGITFELDVTLTGDAFSGESTWSGPWGEDASKVTGTRPPSRSHVHSADEAETHYSCKD